MAEIKRIIVELLVIAVVALAVGLFQNGISEAGISLTRDYFPKHKPATGPATDTAAADPVVEPPLVEPATVPSTEQTPPDTDAAVEQTSPPADPGIPQGNGSVEPSLPDDGPMSKEEQTVLEFGLQPIRFAEMKRIYDSQEYRDGLYIIVDARTREHYVEGHIPGAYHLDHYRLERGINQVLPSALGALKVVTYCMGGDCEDSRFVAFDLRDRGVRDDALFVYVGGMQEWKAKDMPLETGNRGSAGGN